MLGLIVGESSLPRFVINKLLKKNLEFLILDLVKSIIKNSKLFFNNLFITNFGKVDSPTINPSIYFKGLQIGLFSLFSKKLMTSLTVLKLENCLASCIPFFKRVFEKINFIAWFSAFISSEE